MGIVNRRNAIVGFATIKIGKAIARRKARQLRSSVPFARGKRG